MATREERDQRTSCSMCGSPVPKGQAGLCSMCYGDVGYGKDGYYEDWCRQQYEQERDD